MKHTLPFYAATLAFGLVATTAFAADEKTDAAKSYDLTIKNHKFEPDTLKVPANSKIVLRVKNADTTAEEFESDDLSREKVIPAGDTLNINVGPLKPGTYEFEGEYHEDTAKGKIIAE